jgi:hypothetical protein
VTPVPHPDQKLSDAGRRAGGAEMISGYDEDPDRAANVLNRVRAMVLNRVRAMVLNRWTACCRSSRRDRLPAGASPQRDLLAD